METEKIQIIQIYINIYIIFNQFHSREGEGERRKRGRYEDSRERRALVESSLGLNSMSVPRGEEEEEEEGGGEDICN